MDAADIAAIGYAVAAGLFLVLTALLLSRWRNRSQSQVLAIATFASAAWACVLAAQSSGVLSVPYLAMSLELLRNVCWIIALTMVLRGLDDSRKTERVAIRYALFLPVAAIVLFALYRSRSIEPLSDVLLVVGGMLLILRSASDHSTCIDLTILTDRCLACDHAMTTDADIVT